MSWTLIRYLFKGRELWVSSSLAERLGLPLAPNSILSLGEMVRLERDADERARSLAWDHNTA